MLGNCLASSATRANPAPWGTAQYTALDRRRPKAPGRVMGEGGGGGLSVGVACFGGVTVQGRGGGVPAPSSGLTAASATWPASEGGRGAGGVSLLLWLTGLWVGAGGSTGGDGMGPPSACRPTWGGPPSCRTLRRSGIQSSSSPPPSWGGGRSGRRGSSEIHRGSSTCSPPSGTGAGAGAGGSGQGRVCKASAARWAAARTARWMSRKVTPAPLWGGDSGEGGVGRRWRSLKEGRRGFRGGGAASGTPRWGAAGPVLCRWACRWRGEAAELGPERRWGASRPGVAAEEEGGTGVAHTGSDGPRPPVAGVDRRWGYGYVRRAVLRRRPAKSTVAGLWC